MSTTIAVASGTRRGPAAFVVAWVFCIIFYFAQYALRSSPGVMIPELTATFGLSTLGVSSLLGLYYYTYSTFSLVAGASLDRLGAKYVVFAVKPPVRCGGRRHRVAFARTGRSHATIAVHYFRAT